MFANRYTALIDANVLANAPKRDLILTLARAEMYRFRWTGRILEETESALVSMFLARDFDDAAAQTRAAASIAAMVDAFPEAMIDGDFSDTPIYDGIPDPNDHHILHAAIRCQASMLVTDNVRDFPTGVLEPYAIEIATADNFIADAIDLDAVRAAEAVKGLRARLSNPPMEAETLLDIWDTRHGLSQTVSLLRPYQGLI